MTSLNTHISKSCKVKQVVALRHKAFPSLKRLLEDLALSAGQINRGVGVESSRWLS